ncbi:MAG: serine hydrolase [Clostridia bacterium]|nr:serine hydrolase [Clostridia bacterium]
MKTVCKAICIVLASLILAFAALPAAYACKTDRDGEAVSWNWNWKCLRKERAYTPSDERQAELKKVYNRYNFSLAWGLYDISGKTLKEVASYHADEEFQSNCTIKAAMLLLICKRMDAGKLSLGTKLKVSTGKLHYDDFYWGSGKYTVKFLLERMIHVSNNSCYEVFLRYVGRENFNEFLKGLGSGTVIRSYNYMGECLTRDRATEWFALYNYCHSGAKHADHAWKLLCEAKYSPIRDGIGRPAAHKSGWHYEDGVYGTAGDCAVVQTENGGCYLMVMFTRNNVRGNYSQKLMRELAVALDHVWDEYYTSLPKCRRTVAEF